MEKRKMKVFGVLILTAVLLLSAGCGAGTSDDKASGEQTGENKETVQLMGTFKGVTIEGDALDETYFSESKLTMINVWATYCSPCIRELPDLGQIARDYESNEFQILGIISDVSQANDETTLNLIEETKADYTHLLGTSEIYDILLNQVQAVPTTYFVDQDGNQVGEAYTGSKSQSQWEDIIKEKLKEIQ